MNAAALKSLDGEYDSVVILDCLPKSQRVGMKLSHDVGRVIHKLGYSYTIFPCDTGDAVRAALNKTGERAEGGQRVILHIIAHGSEPRIVVGDGKQPIKWDELAVFWERINIAMRGTLLVMMTTCKGINAIKAANTASSPFFGLIGTKDNLPIKTARKINAAFYSGLRNGQNIKDFIKNAEAKWGRSFVRGLTAEFWKKYRAGELGSPKTP